MVTNMTEETPTENNQFVNDSIEYIDKTFKSMNKAVHAVPEAYTSAVSSQMYLFMASFLISFIDDLMNRDDVPQEDVEQLVETYNADPTPFSLLPPEEAYKTEGRKVILDHGYDYCFFLAVPDSIDQLEGEPMEGEEYEDDDEDELAI